MKNFSGLFWPILILWIGLWVSNMVQLQERDSLQDRIEYLEEYIEENKLPTPSRQL